VQQRRAEQGAAAAAMWSTADCDDMNRARSSAAGTRLESARIGTARKHFALRNAAKASSKFSFIWHR
jgi:hypothetical protein